MNKAEKLRVLRDVTRLDLKSFLKVIIECKKAERLRDICEINDPTHFYSVDYTQANELEYKLRMNILRENLRKPFEHYIQIENDGALLEDFVEKYLEEHYSTDDSIGSMGL